MLRASNLEVVYDHVVLVLRGESVSGAGRGGSSPPWLQRGRQEHDP